MFAHSLFSIAALVLQAQAAAPAASGTPSDTIPKPPELREASARVIFQFGSSAGVGVVSGAPILVRGLEVSFASQPSPAPAGQGAPAPAVSISRLRFVKDPDAVTAELARRGMSGERIDTVMVEVIDGNGSTIMRLRVARALVASDRLSLDPSGGSLEQQHLSLMETIAQLSADLQEARRQLALNEALDKKRATSSLEVARAKERVSLMETRLAVQQRRLEILRRQIASRSPVDEEVTLSFSKFEIEAPEGARTAWSPESGRGGRK